MSKVSVEINNNDVHQVHTNKIILAIRCWWRMVYFFERFSTLITVSFMVKLQRVEGRAHGAKSIGHRV